GGVEEGHSEIDGRPDDLDPLLLLDGRAVARTQAHAAEAQRRHLQVALPEFALLHGALLRGCARRQAEQRPPAPPSVGARGHDVSTYRPLPATAITWGSPADSVSGGLVGELLGTGRCRRPGTGPGRSLP